MFSRSDAESLRGLLTEIDFTLPAAESDLLSRYKSHYGLGFDDLSLNGSSLGDSSLGDSSLGDSSLGDSSLDGSSLDGSSLDGSSLDGSSPDGSSLGDSSFNGSSLDSLSFDAGTSAVCHRAGHFQSHDQTIVCQYFALPEGVAKGCAFLLHGYYDHTGLYGHLIRHCLRCGYSVMIFDLPGHGLSTGAEASIDSFQEYGAALQTCCELARNEVPEPWVLVGQSTGGAVAMDSLLTAESEQLARFRNCILLCPLLYTANWRWSRLMFHSLRWFVPAISRNFAINSHDQAFLDFLKNSDSLQSRSLPAAWVAAMIDYHRRFNQANKSGVDLHIIQGTGDGTVAWRRNIKLIKQKFPAAKTCLIPDARHHLVNESAPYRDQVFSKISRILAG